MQRGKTQTLYGMRNVPDELEPLGDWELFRTSPDENAALTLAGKLRDSECPAKVSPRKLANGLETEYQIYVPCSLAHRARWILAQLPVSDEELESLAMRAPNREKGK
jgi:hypothetical protein